jgi:hypothetical protein
MKCVALFFILIEAAVVPALAQKIETETNDRTRIVHLKTALNHLTVIEVTEPVVQVAAGSPSFKVEWRENKVFVQPTEADAASNLFIWTANQRLNYELEPAGAVAEMDFAVDQKPVHVEPIKPISAPPAAAPSATDLFLTGTPIRLLPSKQRATKPVEVWISDVYEKNGSLLVRYAVRNYSSEAYSIDMPTVYELHGVRSPKSLYGIMNSQLDDEEASKLKVKRQTPVKILDAETPPGRIAPGEEAVGVVSVEVSSDTQPTVLRFAFPSRKQSDAERSGRAVPQIDAFLVR